MQILFFILEREIKQPFILELKKDTKPIKAINQMKEKDYAQKLREENEDKKILAVAICYNSKQKNMNV